MRQVPQDAGAGYERAGAGDRQGEVCPLPEGDHRGHPAAARRHLRWVRSKAKAVNARNTIFGEVTYFTIIDRCKVFIIVS